MTEIKMRPDAITKLKNDNAQLLKENNALRAQVLLLTQEIDNLHYQIEEMKARSIV